jgi:hypothetical protein
MDEKQLGRRQPDPETVAKLKAAMDQGILPTPGQVQKLSRQQRREKERSAKKFNQRQTFTKAEVEAMNQHSYEHGTAFALWAAAKVLGLGETRLDRIRMEIADLELQYFHGITLDPLPFDVAEVNRYKGVKK